MKKKNILLRLLSIVAVLAMVAVMTLSLASCGSDKKPGGETKADTTADTAVNTSDDTAAKTDTEKAEDAAVIEVKVVHADGTSKVFNINTTKGATLRSALESINLVEGDESEYGLYVKVVDGERADYDKDGAYWSFYQDGEYMSTGVDSTFVNDGDKFEIAYAK